MDIQKLIILGSSPAGVKVAEEIRKNLNCEVTIISLDGNLPFEREKFPLFLNETISLDDVFYKPAKFYQETKFNVIVDQKITRINFKRKRIFFESKETLDYDLLIVTDTPEERYPDIKGTNKSGLYGLRKFKDVQDISKFLSITETITIQSDSFSALQSAVALCQRGKEVFLMMSSQGILARACEENVLTWLIELFEVKGLRIVLDDSIQEILGDSELKAIRLKSGKVLAAQMVIFPEANEDLRLFSDIMTFNKKICADHDFKTSLEGVLALDNVWANRDCHFPEEEFIETVVLQEQAQTLANKLNGHEGSFHPPVFSRTITLDDLTLTVLGQTQVIENAQQYSKFDAEAGTYCRYFTQGSYIIGGVFINAKSECEQARKLITEKLEVLNFEELIPNNEVSEVIS